MRMKRNVIPVLALITAALVGVESLGLTGCDIDSGTNTGGTTDTVVDTLNLTALVTAPVKGAAPVTTAIDQTQYTGTIAWKTNADAAHTGAFAASTVYKAEVTLTAKTGYTLTGVAANSFTHSGGTVTNAANSGTVTITFPATTGPTDPDPLTALNLTALVTAPVKNAAPVTTAINETQYTGTIAWKTATDTDHTGAFAVSTVYKAAVTLTPKTGYTLTGVAANSFTYSGASVTNAANSGTVTITFPATTAAGVDDPVSNNNLTTMVSAPVKGATQNTTAIDTAQYTGTVVWFENNGTTAAPAVFAANTVYKAVVTLTVKTGFTLTGVAADSFTHSGGTVTNAANSGTITITFPATTAAGMDDPVTALNLTDLVTAPVKDATPVTTAINETQYTGTIAWKTGADVAHTGAFVASTVYKAVFTLTPKTGYTFTGVAVNSFTHSGGTVTNAANSGTVTITFPATAAAGGVETVVNDLNLTALVTTPAKDASPVTTAINETQYTGSIAWKTSAGAAHSGAFAASTVYKVEVTLTAKTGYTFTGVAADSFTYTSATVTNAVNSGTVTITFPATSAADVVVNALNLTALVTAPAKDATPVTTAINATQYTGAIAWKTSAGGTHTGAFAASTVYKVEVTLTAKTGYTFTGVAADSFTYTSTTVTNAVNSGTVTITFPATAAADVVVTALNLTALVTAPAKDATPVTTAINATQYTGAIAWKTSADAAHSGAFAASTVYKAEVTLTAKTGYTFTGVAADSFTYTSATVTNAADSGTVTITFPATAAADVVVNALALTTLVTAPAKDASPVTTAINETQYTGSIAWKTNAGAAHSGAFAASTVYKAEVTLTAKTGYTFTGVAANSFTYTSAAVTNAVNSGTVTITFPATAAADVVVTDLNLTTLVTAPAKDASPVTTAINETQYTGSIAWKTNAGAAHSGAFAASTVYKAEVTLTAKTGYTFTGVAANSFTHTGATTITNAVNSGTVTITFLATAAADVVVTDLNLTALITAPAKDASPVTTAINQTQYTGNIAWKTNAGGTHTGAFAASTVYKAEVTLTAKTGYTFTGVAANSFTYTSATVTNAVNSGTVTITFPATADPTGERTMTVNLWTDDTTVFASTPSETLSRAASQTALITGLSGDEYTDHQWSINGSDVAAPQGTASTFTFDSAGKSDGNYKVGLQVKKDNAWYLTTITITVTN
ncbi:hypothetical protein AGMMS4952_22930 [Spirochaetia bacterium]|nr:hypothetical protein AGMMS4952_22930 [Spirochaetia bacterium]